MSETFNGGTQTFPLVRQEVGPPGQRWQYGEGEFLRDYTEALGAYTVPGYPEFEERLRFDDPSQVSRTEGNVYVQTYVPYDTSKPWCLDDYPASHPEHTPKFVDDGGIHPPTKEEWSKWKEMGIRLDQRGMPLHPYAESMLLGGRTSEGEWVQPGGVVTPGAYFKRGRGPLKTADMLLMAEKKGKLYGLFIDRKDNGLLAIPGGHLEDEDKQLSEQIHGVLSEYEVGGIRELKEETGVEIKGVESGKLSCSGLAVVLKKVWAGCGADQRATLHAWPQGEAFAVFLPKIPRQKPQASSDATKATWLPMSEKTFSRLAKFSSHYTIGRRAVRLYRDQTGTRLAPDGRIM